MFNSSDDEDDNDLFDGSKNDEKLKNVDSSKTLVGELSSKIVDKKDRVLESSSSDESEQNIATQEAPKATNPMPTSFIGELSSRIVANRGPPPSQNGTLSSSSQEIRVVEPAKPVLSSTQKPVGQKDLQNTGESSVPKIEPKKEKSIFDSGSSSGNEADEALFKKPNPVPAKSEPAQPANPVKVETKSKKSLFDSDSDSDDLFSSSRPVKPKILAAKEEKKVGLFSSEDEDLGLAAKSQTVESKPVLKEVVISSEIKKVTPKIEAKKVESKEVKSAATDIVVKQIAATLVTKKTKSLFENSSSSDDDMDVLFKKASAKPSPVVTDEKRKKEKSLFSESSDEDDPIFGAPKNSETPKLSNLITNKSDLVKNEEPKVAIETKSEEMEKAKIVEAKKMEFLAKASILELPSPGKVPNENKSLAENTESSAEKIEDDVDGNVMSMKKESKFKDILTAKLAKGPKVIGGGSKPRKMSTSNDDNLKSQKHSSADKKSSETTPNPADQKLAKQKQPVDQKQFVEKIEAVKKTPEVPIPVQKVENPANRVEAEKKKPKIEFPNIEKIEPSHEAESVNTLEPLTKSRAKLPTNRRAPTRKGLKAMSQTGIDQADSSIKHYDPDSAAPKGKPVNPFVQSSPEGPIIQSAIPKSDPVLKEVRPKNEVSDNSVEEKSQITIKETEADSIKAAAEHFKTASSKSPDSSQTESKIAFEKASSSSQKEVEPESSVKTQEMHIANTSLKTEPETKSPLNDLIKTEDSSSNIKSAESSDEDLFGPPPMPDVIKTNSDPLFGDDDDDDDLFGTKNVSKISSTISRGIFDDDSDDDLFASN